MSSSEEKTADAGRRVAHTFVMWVCVMGTLAVLALGGWFLLQLSIQGGDIKGRVVMLQGADAPANEAPQAEVRKWMEVYAPAFPGCLCSLGKGAQEHQKDRALLFCVGRSSGSEECMFLPESLPLGVSAKVSSWSDVGTDTKIVFLISRYGSPEIVDPRTDRTLEEPSMEE